MKFAIKKKNSPTAEREYSYGFIDIGYLRNNRTLVKKGDVIAIKSFYIDKAYKNGEKVYYINITDWELKDKYDYSKLKDIEYRGADYDEDE